ncbi:MAG: NAD(P)/FAD-dependent oxidoreductase [Acidaminococcaceae bacterium]
MGEIFDIAIIGGGPAGLSAAVTASIRNKKVIIFDFNGFSPRLRRAHMVSNYLGLPNISGQEMMEKFVEHAMSFDPKIVKEKVIYASQDEQTFTLGTANGFYNAKSIILSIGASSSEIIPGEKEFLGRGVSYCATCDGHFFKGKKVAAVVTLPSALEEVEFLAEICESVILMPHFKIEGALKHSNIVVIPEEADEITGTDRVTGVRTKHEYYPVHGVFIFRESDPIDSLFPELRLHGKTIATGEEMETNIEGIFAAGDCTGQPWQISRASGQGLVAALSAVKYLAKLKDE